MASSKNNPIKQTTVVNKRKEPDGSYTYIGRGSPFGNPFSIGQDGNRDQVIEKYKIYFYDKIDNDPVFADQVLRLTGERLGCFCAPHACHGDIIKEYLDSLQLGIDPPRPGSSREKSKPSQLGLDFQ